MTIFEFSNFQDYLKFQVSGKLYGLNGRKKSNLTKLSRTLGYSSPSLLSMVLNGKRLPSDELCHQMSKAWRLSPKESDYLGLLVLLERQKSSSVDTSETQERLRRLAGSRAKYYFLEDQLSRIREWYYIVIQQLVELPRFKEDAGWISRMLRHRITPAQAQQSLSRLESMGIIERDPETKRLRPASRFVESSHDIPSSAIRDHQRGMILKAIEALDDRPVTERLFNTLTFNMEYARLEEARRKMLEFMRWMNEEFSSAKGDSVFQLNLQFFEHTCVDRKKGGIQNEN